MPNRREFFKEMAGATAGVVFTGCGVSQIMVGTDYPFPWSTTTVDHVLNTPGLSNADKVAILRGNAARLLKITS